MKLYTEEQVKRAIKLARECDSDCWGVDFYNGTTDEIVVELTTIELPSDEEIENYADFAFPNAEKIGKETYSAYRGMKVGAKWVIELIKQQDNGK